jgi:hypothetical protein
LRLTLSASVPALTGPNGSNKRWRLPFRYKGSRTEGTALAFVQSAVIDNTTGATRLSCTVSSPRKHCSAASGSGSAAAGDKIEVKVTATGPSGNNKGWQMTFRY